MQNRLLLTTLFLATLMGCQSNTTGNSDKSAVTADGDEAELTEDPILREQVVYGDEASVKLVTPRFETTPVQSLDDAADDPAIWLHPTDSSKSLIIGTDKKSGLGVYNLQGQQVQFLPLGLPNNVDIRQNVTIDKWQGDIAAASDRRGDVITFFAVSASGVVALGDTPASLPEPYGFCLGTVDDKVIAFVTYKTGETVAHHIQQLDGKITAPVVGQLAFATQLEGCVVDDAMGRIYVGEEETGIWTAKLSWQNNQLAFSSAVSIDDFSSNTGIIADIEGLGLYQGTKARYLVASSQGNDSYAVYDAENYQFLGRFRISANGTIDGSQETDGLAVSSANLGPDFPNGILVVQDGFNGVDTAQNFKLIDWREIEAALGL
jgi:3-phytase